MKCNNRLDRSGFAAELESGMNERQHSKMQTASEPRR
jgi:hypothetical protein